MACQKPIDKVDKLLVLGMQRHMNIQKVRCQNPRSSHVESVSVLERTNVENKGFAINKNYKN